MQPGNANAQRLGLIRIRQPGNAEAVLRYVVKMNPDSSEIRLCVDVADENEHVTRVWLKCQCGPGDDPEPVLTVMLPEEA